MNPRFVKLARRSLIGLIVVVLLAVMTNYVLTLFRRANAVKKAVEVLSSDTTRSAQSMEIFESKNGIVNFKIRLQRLVENRMGKSFLEGIEAYDLNPDGSVQSEIRSQKAEYDRERKTVDFSGNVHLLFGKAVEIRTQSLHYDLNTNVGMTSDPLQFYTQSVRGKARGIRYDSGQKSVALHSEVDFTLDPKSARTGSSKDTGSVHVISERADFTGTANRIVFQGHARMESEKHGTIAGESVEALLSSDRRRVTSLVSTGDAAYQSNDADEARVLSGDRIAFGIGDAGVLNAIGVTGNAAFSSNSPSEEKHLNGERIDLKFDAGTQALSHMEGYGGVLFRIKRGTEQSVVSGEQLRAQFAAGTKNLQEVHVLKDAKYSTENDSGSARQALQSNALRVHFRPVNGRAAFDTLRADGAVRWTSAPPAGGNRGVQEPIRTLEASLLEMVYASEGDYLKSGMASGNVIISESPAGQSAQAQVRRLRANSARFDFFPQNGQIKDLSAEGNVRIAYETKKSAPDGGAAGGNFQTSSDFMRAIFALAQGRSAIETAAQWGHFTCREAKFSASAGRGDFDAGKSTLTLKESPEISDETSTTTGDHVEYDQKQKVLWVQGNVRTRMKAQKGAGSFFVSATSSASSSHAVVMADEMRYWAETGSFRYSGNVRSFSESQQLFARSMEIAGSGDRVEAQGAVRHRIKETQKSGGEKDAPPSPQAPIDIRSERLQYSKTRNEVTYSGTVLLSSEDVRVASGSLEAKLDKDGMVENATASGAVRISHQNGRECKGDRARWSLDTGTFVVEGNPAEIRDPVRGRSAAPRLTYFKANDTILLGNP